MCPDRHVQLANREQFLATHAAYYAYTAAQLAHYRTPDDDTSSWSVVLLVHGVEEVGWIAETRKTDMYTIDVLLAYPPENTELLDDETSLVRVYIGGGEELQREFDASQYATA
jgi:hypothetical protein